MKFNVKKLKCTYYKVKICIVKKKLLEKCFNETILIVVLCHGLMVYLKCSMYVEK